MGSKANQRPGRPDPDRNQAAMFNALTLRSCRWYYLHRRPPPLCRRSSGAPHPTVHVHLLCRQCAVHITNEGRPKAKSPIQPSVRQPGEIQCSVSVSTNSLSDAQTHRYSARTQRQAQFACVCVVLELYGVWLWALVSGLWHSLYAVYFIFQRQKLYYAQATCLGFQWKEKFYTVNRGSCTETEPKRADFLDLLQLKRKLRDFFIRVSVKCFTTIDSLLSRRNNLVKI